MKPFLPSLFSTVLAVVSTGLFSGAQDLWNEKGEIFTDSKAFPVGTVVQVIFDEPFVLSYQSSLQRQTQKQVQSPDVQSQIFDFFPKLALNTTSKESGNVQATAGRNFRGSIAGTVLAFDPQTQNYRVSASHSIVVNGKSDTLQISGTVHWKDLGKDRTVSSKRVANIQITYSGYVITRGKVFTERDFSSMGISQNTNATNTAQLTEQKKKELFLEYFNILLNELF